ncbi:hypothetical protein Tco_0875567 [Tanacetum coccineum]|uniref:Uncharacterized protein n=1 Tax=Tanacetum coccineum TaxID=301880 RepID=A0ABQ5BSN2_9ASTR
MKLIVSFLYRSHSISSSPSFRIANPHADLVNGVLELRKFWYKLADGCQLHEETSYLVWTFWGGAWMIARTFSGSALIPSFVTTCPRNLPSSTPNEDVPFASLIEWIVEPTAPRLLISVLPIMMLYGERQFTIANFINTILFLLASHIVTQRSITPKGWYVSPKKPISGALHLLSLDQMLILRSLAVSSSPYHVYDFYVVPSLTPVPLVVPADILPDGTTSSRPQLLLSAFLTDSNRWCCGLYHRGSPSEF